MKKIIIAICFVLLCFPNRSFALVADIGGMASWQTYPADGNIAIHADQICNNDPGSYSGAIRVGVWAFTQQFYGQTFGGYLLGSFTLGSLAYGICWTDVANTVTYSPPPCGNYYTYVITETWDGYLWHTNDWASTGYLYICDQPTTTTSIITTTTVQLTTTTTIGPCAAETVYGEDSEATEMLRHYRDDVLSKTPEGQEVIKSYYKFSPTVTKLLEQRPLLKKRAKSLIDSMLPEIRKKVEESKRK